MLILLRGRSESGSAHTAEKKGRIRLLAAIPTHPGPGPFSV